MQKIVPHLWFDTQAKEAARFYVDAFGGGSKILQEGTIDDTPTGSVDTVSLQILGLEFIFLSAGPGFTITPAISFMVSCGSPEEVDALWAKLSDGGTVMMELGEYPFSPRFGWVQDRFGVSWQLSFVAGTLPLQRVTPMLMYTGDAAGKAEEAIARYAAVFGGSAGGAMRYGPDEAPDREGTIKFISFELLGVQFAAMDSAHTHAFTFTEAVSLMVRCETQDEIDRYWTLSANPEAEQCGWLQDAYGVSWQVVPASLDAMLLGGTPEQRERVTGAFLSMKKFDIALLEAAYAGEG